MPTNAEIHAAIDLLIRQPHSHILTNEIADLLDDIVDNIDAGGSATPTLEQVLDQGAEANARIHELTDPENDQDAATKVYVDSKTLDEVLAAGSTLTEEAVISLNGHDFEIVQDGLPDGAELFYIVPPATEADPSSVYLQGFNNTDGGNAGGFFGDATPLSAGANMSATFNNETTIAEIRCTAGPDGANIKMSGLQEFADNAAAITAGLEAGMLYRTAGAINIVI